MQCRFILAHFLGIIFRFYWFHLIYYLCTVAFRRIDIMKNFQNSETPCSMAILNHKQNLPFLLLILFYLHLFSCPNNITLDCWIKIKLKFNVYVTNFYTNVTLYTFCFLLSVSKFLKRFFVSMPIYFEIIETKWSYETLKEILMLIG